jgi:P pilus assembly chaperone PapD
MNVRSVFSGMVAVFIGLVAVVGATAQYTYDRLSVIEEFTSATCPPCVAASEALLETVKMSNGVVSVRYHMNYPAPNDPWNLDNPAEAYARHTFYGVQGIPHGRLNGANTPITNSAGMLSAIATDNAKKAPMKIEVTTVPNATGGDVTIKITSNIDLKSHKLYAAVVSRFAPWPGLSQTLANSNGEEEFYDAMNKMLPNSAGTQLNINAQGNQTFNFSYTRKNAQTWPEGQQYVIAWVQSTTSTEVLQAGTDLDVVNVKASVVAPKWEYIARGAQKSKVITVTNDRDAAVDVEVGVENYDNLVAAGWGITSSETVLSIPAKSSREVTFTSTANNRAFLAGILVTLKPLVTGKISEVTKIEYGYLTEDSKIAVYYGSTNGAAGNMIPALETTHGNDCAYMPFAQEILTAFPPTDFDAAIFPVGYDGRFNIVAFIPAIEAMSAAGKGVWMHAPIGIAVATNPGNQQYAGYPEANAWFTKLGLSLNGTQPVARNDGQYYTSFALAGVSGDPIGDKWGGTANQPTQQWPFAMPVQDLIKITGNTCISWAYADSKVANVSGVRCETGGAKIVYSSFGPEHMSSAAVRKTLVQNVLDWLLKNDNAPKPEITFSSNTLNFGSVMVGSEKELSFTITNSGNADLVISSIELAGTDAVDFDITEGRNSVTVPAAGTHKVTVSFMPSTVKSTYNASVVVTANAGSNPVSLRGSGTVSSVETDVVSETGAISMRLNGENPIVDRSSIVLNASEKVSVTMIDALGRTVATLFNGIASGTETLEVNAANLVSGTYTIVASNGSERAMMTVMVTK